ncbi:TetR/AcrR family transcriptional regulator [Citromicrobium bathyomarinum]
MMTKTSETTPPYTGKREEIVDAAAIVFARYGFARTSMADLAQAVGMSRTALYPLFRNKSDVFDAVIRHAVAKTIAAIRQELDQHETLDAKLRFALVDWIVRGYEFVHAMPDARDLFDYSVPAVQEAYTAMEALLAEILAAHVDRPDVDVRLLARIMTATFRSLKEVAVDTADLRRMIDLEITVIVAALR